jgi:alcohol dehydrogenase
MRALTYQGPRQVAYEQVPDPVPDHVDGAVVRITACGICGSDLHIYEGHGFSPDLGYCIGHEAVGEVVEVGSGVRNFSVGDRVLVSASTGCGSCGPCRRGWVLGCERGLSGCYGLSHALEGSQAEAVGVPFADGNLARIPASISDDAALVLTDNAPTAWFGARQARIRIGDVVAVVGCGPVGLMAIAAAQIMGASKVFAIDLVEERRQLAATLGAEPIGDDPVRQVRELTSGRGVDAVIEAVGADATITLALSIAAVAGRVSVIGVSHNQAFPFKLMTAQTKCLEFTAGLCSVQQELPTLLRLTEAGRLHPEQVVTHHLPLSEGAAAYELFHSRADGVGKVVLDPTR